MSTLTEERKAEIAFKVLKYRMREEGVKITPNFHREIGNISKKIGVDKAELKVFIEILTRELVDEVFASES